MNAYTASAWINQPGMFLFYCTTNGWWGLIVALTFAERTATHR